jgi:hypothetical protein
MDVTGQVTARIQARQSEQWDPMAVVAGAAAAAAIIVIIHAIQAWSVLQDPFVSLLAPMNLVLQ